MTIQFLVPGEEDRIAVGVDKERPPEKRSPAGEIHQAVRATNDRATQQLVRVEAEPGKDVVVLQITGGPELMLHPETARSLFQSMSGAHSGRRGAAGDDVVVPSRLRWPQRGAGEGEQRAGDVLLASFRVLRSAAVQATVGAVLKRFDGEMHQGVHRLEQAELSIRPGQDPPPPIADAPGPILVLVHGTFSSTKGTFGRLWSEHPDLMASVFRHYNDRVYAFEHATLGKSPIENALDLVRALPEGTVLHLLTHSRGGLVAEVLARACADDGHGDVAKFGGDAESCKALKQLHEEVWERRIRVARIVRVACPARGTLLASRRLDAYLSVVRWTLELAKIPVLPHLVSFLAEVARTRLDPAQVPGLAAQVPDSPLVRWLHQVNKPIPGELRVVAGDVAGDSIASWLKVLVADSFFWTDNDLVVQTRSMYGGAPRERDALFVLDRAGAVSHFSYFAHEGTARMIVGALVEAAPVGFQPIGPKSYGGELSSGIRASPPATSGHQAQRPAVVLVPGMAGSQLKRDGQRLWLSWRLAHGFDQLAVAAADGIAPDGIIGTAYEALVRYLAESHEVIPFDYDWRRPMEQAAERLGTLVTQAVRARVSSRQPVRILAHSTGGLVARAMQFTFPEAWDEWMARAGSRLLMLGTPNEGCWTPMQVLSGDETFGGTLGAYGMPFEGEAARQVMAGFVGLLQAQAGLLDPDLKVHLRETWEAMAKQDEQAAVTASPWHAGRQDEEAERLRRATLKWGVPSQDVLDAAVTFRKQLDKQRDGGLARYADRLCIVLGTALRTPDGFESGQRGLQYNDLVGPGDGRVTDRNAMLPGVAAWRAPATHGGLPGCDAAWPTYLELLVSGRATRLPAIDASKHPGAPANPARHARSRPSHLDSGVPPAASDPLADSSAASDVARSGTLQVVVRNSNLGFVKDPVIVGHYTSFGLSGSEAALDSLLQGKLARSLRAGDYPQVGGMVKIFANTSPLNPRQLPRPEAVVVVGIGPEGALRPKDLEHHVANGVVAWALHVDDRPEHPAELEVAATLIGSGGMDITAGLAAQLVAQGVREANQRLRNLTIGRPAAPKPPVVQRLLFVELYLERAGEAWRSLKELEAANPGDFQVEDQIESTESALERHPGSSYRGTDYDLIIAKWEGQASNGVIEYRVDTRRARSELHAHSAQTPLLKHLLQHSSGDRSGCSHKLGQTLFQLLVPIELAPFMGTGGATLIEVDEDTAAIPWELLETPRDDESGASPEPWAIRTKLLRKFSTADYRPQPRDATWMAGVLVVGEPRCPPGYSPLPGARQEALAVVDQLQGVSLIQPVKPLIRKEPPNPKDEPGDAGPEAATVIETLLDRPWRVVHIAGHGAEPTEDDPHGVVLSGGIHLGPREVRSMRVVPELVFVNCCFSGTPVHGLEPKSLPASGRPRFAASLAMELIQMGVKCVVATGWAVDDTAAAAFASTFYGALVRGTRFIDAVAVARRAAHFLGGSTWSAYQCYGDPDWRLFPDLSEEQVRRGKSGAEMPIPASVNGLVIDLRAIATRATYLGDEHDGARSQVQTLEKRFADSWGCRGRVAEAFARAWEALGDTERALRWYAKAAAARDGGASLRTGERLQSLRARAAWEKVRENVMRDDGEVSSKAELEAALSDMEQDRTRLKSLNFGISAHEMHHRLASIDKRLAMVAMRLRKPAVVVRILRTRIGYERAWTAATPLPNTEGLNAAMNVLAADVALGRPILAKLEAEVQALVAARNQSDPDFWSVACGIELDTWKALGAHELLGVKESIGSQLRDLYTRVPSLTKWQSMYDDVLFVAIALRTGAENGSDQKVIGPTGEDLKAVQWLLSELHACAFPDHWRSTMSSTS